MLLSSCVCVFVCLCFAVIISLEASGVNVTIGVDKVLNMTLIFTFCRKPHPVNHAHKVKPKIRLPQFLHIQEKEHVSVNFWQFR